MLLRNISQSYQCLLIVVIIIHLSVSGAAGSHWHFRNRFQAGLEWDDNFQERQTGTETAIGGRLLVQSRGEKRGNGYLFSYHYTGAFQGYAPHLREDKLINEGKMRFDFHLFKGISGGIEGWGRHKNFIYEPIDYYLISSTASLRALIGWNLTVRVSLQPQQLNYAVNDYYDYTGLETGIALTKNFSRKLSLELGWRHLCLEFNRTAQQGVQPFPERHFFSFAQNQADKIQKYSLQFLYAGQWFCSLSYLYEYNQSNSSGFSYRNHWLIASLSKKISASLLLRFYAMLQQKNYTEPFYTNVPLELDTEKIDSNFFIVDLSRTLTGGAAVFMRYAWYKNESLYRSIYYQKNLLTTGLEYRF